MSRAEHLQWCKERALSYLDHGDIKNAISSMLSDLGKHEETKDHMGIKFFAPLALAGELSTSEQVKKFIEGFN